MGRTMPPTWVRDLCQRLTAFFEGALSDWRDVPLDWQRIRPFDRAVYQMALTIPFGETRTYGEVAEVIGRPNAARAVGGALGRNPFAPIVPCHRVVARNGLGGFSADDGISLKQKLLQLEQRDSLKQPRQFPSIQRSKTFDDLLKR